MWPQKNLNGHDIEILRVVHPVLWESHVCLSNNVCFTFSLLNNGTAEWPVDCLIHRAPAYEASWKRGLTEKLWRTVGGGVSADLCKNTLLFN